MEITSDSPKFKYYLEFLQHFVNAAYNTIVYESKEVGKLVFPDDGNYESIHPETLEIISRGTGLTEKYIERLAEKVNWDSILLGEDLKGIVIYKVDKMVKANNPNENWTLRENLDAVILLLGLKSVNVDLKPIELDGEKYLELITF